MLTERKIAGYNVVRALGSGAMGDVYLATGEDGKFLAVKLLGKTFSADKAKFLIEKFKMEFSILRELSHPGINRVYDFGWDERLGRYYFTTEYVDGQNFLKVVDGKNVDEVEDLLVQILRTLEYLHSRGIIHCDIKSQNILVTEKNGIFEAKLIDFGLAALGSLDKITGTPSYVAPEVILKNRPDGRADLYSLGVLVYSALAGFNPFRSDDVVETFDRQLNLVPESLTQSNRTVSLYLDEVILKLLKKSPGDRFPTAAHVIRAINYGGKKNYPVETKETFMGYLPVEGNLIGRKTELGRLKNYCIKIKSGKTDVPFVMCIRGGAGVGKRRLLSELKYFAQLNEIDVLELASTDKDSLVRFNNKAAEITWDPSRPLLVACSVFGLIATDKEATAAVKILRNMINAVRSARAISSIRSSPRWAFAFTVNDDEAPLLFYLLDIIDDDAEIVQLGSFSKEETKEYLEILTGSEDLQQAFVRKVFERTGGNPLFTMEVAKALIESGVFYDKYGRWNRDAIDDIGVDFNKLRIPVSVENLLERSYTNALTDEKILMEEMAVWHAPIGANRIFSFDGKTITSLLKNGIIRVDSRNILYSFSNPFFREIVYSKMDQKKRSLLHEKISNYLEKNDPDDYAGIRWHRGRSSVGDKAIDALVELGIHHLKNGRPADAVSAFQEAMSRRGDGEYRLEEILLHTGESLVLLRKYADAISIYSDLLTVQKRKNALSVEISLTLQKLGIAYLRNGDVEKSRSVLNAADTCLKESPDIAASLRIKNLLARCAYMDGKLEEAVRMYEETKLKWKGLSESDKQNVLNNDLAHLYMEQGKFDLALKEFNSDIPFYEEAKADNELERSYYSMAELLRISGDLNGAVKYFEMAFELAKKFSDAEILLRTYNGLGNTFNAMGKRDSAVQWYNRSLDLAIRTGEESNAAAITVNIGLIKKEQGDLENAADYFKSAVNIFERAKKKLPPDMGYIIRANLELANIFMMKRNFGEAERYIDSAEKIACGVPILDGYLSMIKKVETELAVERGEKISADENTLDKDISILDIHKQNTEENMETRHYKYILEINKYLSGESDMDFVLKTILKYAIELSSATAGLLLLLNESGGLEIRSSANLDVDKSITAISVNIAMGAIRKNEAIVTRDASGDERFKSLESVVLLGLKSVLCSPVRSKKGAIGVIYLENRSRPDAFASSSTEMISAFADQAGIAIENARLTENYKTAERNLRKELSETSIHLDKLNSEVKRQSFDLNKRYSFGRLTSESPKMRGIFSVIEKISGTDLSACIVGESGTGKELVAKALHYNGPRSKGPFVPVNCGAIPAGIMESELFGYKTGAFTGAVRDKTGLFEAANGGTLFLDEVGDLDISLQAKLLRVIQEREVMKLGDTRTVKCDVRIVSATNRNLEKMIEEKKFRTDLYFRIVEVRVEMPPLRERTEDIPLLINDFVSEYAAQHGIKKPPEVDSTFVRACLSYNWPGNIRELENAVRVATALAVRGKISTDFLPNSHFLKEKTGRPSSFTEMKGLPELLKNQFVDEENRFDPKIKWKEYEAEIFAAAFKLSGGNPKAVSDNLGIALTTVYKKIGELNLKNSSNPLYAAGFKYKKGVRLDEYVAKVFKAAWEYTGRKPYAAIKLLGVSQGYFYKIMKRW